MHSVTSITELRQRLHRWRAQQQSIALVPTLGNLHQGHLALVERAQQRADRVVVSVFVNPLQFGHNDDLARYPRTPQQDEQQLRQAGVDLLFMPTTEEIYPAGAQAVTVVEVPELSDILCGAQRPGHFRGVATVVTKLFNMVQPDIALFGEKDWQQLTIIRRLVADLNLSVEIIAVPIVRDSDGLALSSRNSYLSTRERQLAPELYRTLRLIAHRLSLGEDNLLALEEEGLNRLRQAGFQPDYVAIRAAESLALPQSVDRKLVILAAVRLGQTRLIDNLLWNAISV
ncbi:pantoate--beta-alanine ligase [Ectothiorhodospiraceae bacterium BW-2]|nr:pantoate--beta-alanine ligase [Ectothiorhodospiraceae bacterium BW-2]